jgi:hypothetical protein
MRAFPSKAADVKERPRIAVISRIAQETVGRGQDAVEKHVLHFDDCV